MDRNRSASPNRARTKWRGVARFRTAFLCGAFLIGCFDGCHASSEADVVLGFLSVNDDPAVGSELAIREVNSVGGIASRRVSTRTFVSVGDSSLEPTGLAGLLDEGIVALIGPETSSTALAVIDELRASQVPAISPSATSPVLSGSTPPLDYFFRTAPSDVFQARLLAARALDMWGCTNAAILAQSDAYGDALADAVEASYAARGTPIATREDVDRFSTDFAEPLSRIADAAPTCVFLLAFPVPAAHIIDQWNDGSARPSVDWVGPEALRSPVFVDRLSDVAFIDGLRGTAPAPKPSSLEFSFFVRIFRSAYGRDPDSREARRYDATAVVLLALARTGGRGGDELRDALHEVSTSPGSIVQPGLLAAGLAAIARGGDVNYFGASGPLDFDANGDVLADYVVWRFDAATGEYVDYEYVPANAIPPSP